MKYQLDNISIKILRKLVGSNIPITLNEFLKEFDIQKRKFYYCLSNINDFLTHLNLDQIKNIRNVGYQIISTKDKTIISEELDILSHHQIILNPEQRQAYNICYFLFPNDLVRIKNLMSIHDISRNTVINDLNDIKNILEKYGMELSVDIKNGYYIDDEVFKKLSVLQYYLFILLETIPINQIHFIETNHWNYFFERLKKLNIDVHNVIDEKHIYVLSAFFSIFFRSEIELKLPKKDIEQLFSIEEKSITYKHFKELNNNKKTFIALQLFGNRTPENILNFEDVDIFVLNAAQKLVENFERISCISLNEREELINSIFLHLKLSSKLQKFSIQLINPLFKEISNRYPDIYYFTEMALKDMRSSIDFLVFDSEIAALTLHFGSHIIRNNKESAKKIKIALVCPSGLSTSKLLRKEIENTIGNIEIVNEISIDKVLEYEKLVDYFITTVDLNSKKPIVKVSPIMSDEDKSKLISTFSTKNYNQVTPTFYLESLINLLKNYVSKGDLPYLIEDVRKLFNLNINEELNIKESLGINQILRKEYITIVDNKLDWKKAIKIASSPLVRTDTFNTTYVDEMIHLIETLGPYIVLKKQTALAHGRANAEQTKLGLSVLICKDGIYFSDEHIVKVLFVLSSPDNESHLQILKDLTYLMDQDDYNYIYDMNDSVEVRNYIETKLR